MKRIICGMVGLCLLASAGLAFGRQAPSLADLARQEQARRKSQARPARVYTNADVPVVAAAAAATATEVGTTKEDLKEGSEEARGAAAGASGAGTRSAGTSGAEMSGAEGGAGTGQGRAGASAGSPAGIRPGVSAGDEGQWRSRMTTAREQVSRAQLQLEGMRTRVLNLQSARALGSMEEGAQATLQRRQQDALQEFDRLRADIEKYQKALADLEAQARQAGVPAGWLR